MVDTFCNVINKSIKKREREFYKGKEQTEDVTNDANEPDWDADIDFAWFNITYKEMMEMVVCVMLRKWSAWSIGVTIVLHTQHCKRSLNQNSMTLKLMMI